MNAPELRILLLEDSPTDAPIVECNLQEAGISFTARRVETSEDFVRALDEYKPDVILADYTLPAFDGLAAVRIARQRQPAVPVIFVTGSIGEERAVELLREGARDYVLKDRLARLGPAVRRAIDDAGHEAERRANERELHRQLDELRRFQKTTVDRELRMKELKEENRRLREQLGVRAQE